jgi:hypothetical protein
MFKLQYISCSLLLNKEIIDFSKEIGIPRTILRINNDIINSRWCRINRR